VCISQLRDTIKGPETLTNDGIIVGESRSRDSEVEVRSIGPVLLNSLTSIVDNTESWVESNAETSGANQDVHLVLHTIIGLDSIGSYPLDAGGDGLHVVLDKSFQETVTGRDTTASHTPLGDDEFLQLLMARTHTSVHLIGNVLAERLLKRGVLLVHAKQAVDLSFDALAEIQMVLWIIGEPLDLLLAEVVLALSRINIRSYRIG
jgi:hypothetical protein